MSETPRDLESVLYDTKKILEQKEIPVGVSIISARKVIEENKPITLILLEGNGKTEKLQQLKKEKPSWWSQEVKAIKELLEKARISPSAEYPFIIQRIATHFETLHAFISSKLRPTE